MRLQLRVPLCQKPKPPSRPTVARLLITSSPALAGLAEGRAPAWGGKQARTRLAMPRASLVLAPRGWRWVEWERGAAMARSS